MALKSELAAREQSAGDKGFSDAEWLDHLDQLEKDINELKATYDLYHMGIEKREPLERRDKIKARIRQFKQAKVNRTSIRFRVQQLSARFVSLETHWTRVEKQKEAGVYYRDVNKKRHQAPEVPQTQPSKPLLQTPSPKFELSETKLQKLYETLLTAKKRCGEAMDIKYEDMAASLRKQAPKLLKETGASSLDFKVVIRQGKASIKAVPKSE